MEKKKKTRKGYPVTINFPLTPNCKRERPKKAIKIKIGECREFAGLGDTVYATICDSDENFDELMNINNIESNGNK